MPQNKKDLKARMMAEAEEVIDKMLSETQGKENLMLSDIERSVRVAGEQIMSNFTAKLADKEAQQERNGICPQCGNKMEYKGRKSRELITETGELSLNRVYYYCPTCRKGFFPPGSTMETE